ncbi:hypothetical protein B0H10DRAFT_2076422, partial [Mycena sp. CBHHK59/15]
MTKAHGFIGTVLTRTDVQHEFIRRLLGIHSHSILSVLFTETGIIPLSYCRPLLALGYLIYLIAKYSSGKCRIPRFATARRRWPALLDIRPTIGTGTLPVPVILSRGPWTIDNVPHVRNALSAACGKWLGDLTVGYAARLPLIQGRLERNENGNLVEMSLKFRQYLNVPVPAHRKALTRLYLSSHILGIAE